MGSYRGMEAGAASEVRRIFLDTGEVPAGLLAEPLRRSWRRSAELGVNCRQALELDPVSNGRLQALRDRNEPLLAASAGVIDGLLRTVVRTPWLVLLLGADGVVADAFNDSSRLSPDLRRIAHPGLDLSETRIGTNGPGTALVEGRPVMVVGGEHFMESNGVYTCAAAPIRDPFGRVAGCLDLSSHCTGSERGFDPVALVSAYARMIESRMFTLLPGADTVLRLAAHGGLFGPYSEAMLALDRDRRVLAANEAAQSLFGLSLAQMQDAELASLFDAGSLDHVEARGGETGGVPLTLVNGLTLLARVERIGAQRPAVLPPARSGRERLPGAVVSAEADGALCAAAIGRAHRAYAHGIPVLLRGETGTGKELLARELHEQGSRRDGPWVAINCAAIPEHLIESELFGYVDGAFTGARKGGAPGKLEQAHRGTLFLDEIGDMPLALQTRLLRVLEERKVTRLGGAKAVAVDFALVSATHQDLAAMARAGTFRLDLYFRLNGMTVQLPPLRQRPGFAAIVERVLADVVPPGAALRIGDAAWARLARHSWPGNLRELASVLRTAAVLAEGGEIRPQDLPAYLDETAEGTRTASLAGSLDEMEAAAIRAAVAAHAGNLAAAARALGISRGTLYRKLRRLGGGS